MLRPRASVPWSGAVAGAGDGEAARFRVTPRPHDPAPPARRTAHASGASSRGATEARARIELYQQFLAQSRLTLLVGQWIALTVFAGLYAHARTAPLVLWVGIYTAINATRLALLFRWRRRPGAWHRRAEVFAVSALAAGASWAALIAFDGPALPLPARLLILAVLAALPIAALPSDALYRPAHTAFCAPILLALGFWSLTSAGAQGGYFLLITLGYAVFVWVCARDYARGLRRNISARLERERLVSRVLALNHRLSSLAYIDPLTGLGNRRWFDSQFARAIGRRKRRASRLALMIIDVDGFKGVNDRYGHDTGDRVLTILAERLRECLRPSDSIARGPGLAARLGGDEFIVLIEEIGDMADTVAARIQQRLSAPIETEHGRTELTVSVGVALAPEHGSELPALTRAADRSLYQAKQGGKNRYALAASQ